MSGGGAMWAEIAQMMHNATMDYAKLGIGLWNDRQSRRMSREALRHQMAYDKNRISWAVADAKRAGLHPLAALGIPAGSSSVMSVGMPSSPRPDGMLNHDFSKFSKMAQEAAALANEQTRLQNAKLREQIASEKAKTQQIKTSVARKDGVKNAITGFDKGVQNLFSFSELPGGRITLNPSKDINVDDLGVYFAYPRFFGDKWTLRNDSVPVVLDYLNDPKSKYGKMLKADERWVRDWSVLGGNEFYIHKMTKKGGLHNDYQLMRKLKLLDERYEFGKGKRKYTPVNRYGRGL